MPQLDAATFPTQVFWLAISFLVLYVLMSRLGLPRIRRIIDERRGRVAGDLERAGQMKSETEAVIAAYEKKLAEARAEAQRTLKETTERLNAEAAERLRAVAQKLAGETAAAEKRIAEAKSAALANVRTIAVDVARAATSKLTGIEVEAARAAAAVDAVLKERL
jgi:F-type H+-transporting ATPase subunit b